MIYFSRRTLLTKRAMKSRVRDRYRGGKWTTHTKRWKIEVFFLVFLAASIVNHPLYKWKRKLCKLLSCGILVSGRPHTAKRLSCDKTVNSPLRCWNSSKQAAGTIKKLFFFLMCFSSRTCRHFSECFLFSLALCRREVDYTVHSLLFSLALLILFATYEAHTHKHTSTHNQWAQDITHLRFFFFKQKI